MQLELRRDISRLQTELRLFDIVLVPAMLAILAIGLGIAPTPAPREGPGMKPRTLVVLVVLAIVAVGLGWQFGTRTEPPAVATSPPAAWCFRASRPSCSRWRRSRSPTRGSIWC